MCTMRPLCFLLLIPMVGFAQSWAPVGAKWTYVQGSCCGPDTNLAVLEVVGDTLLAGRTYSRLEVEQGWFYCHAFLPYLAANADSVWFWDPYQEEEQLLFRWNALPGDTWSTPISAYEDVFDTLYWTVLDTGHVIIDGVFLRKLWMNVDPHFGNMFGVNYGAVTERLGGETAPFTWVQGPCDAETFNRLRCYEDGQIQWQSPLYPSCALGIPDVTRFDDPTGVWYVADTYPQGSPQDPNFIETRTLRYFYAQDTTIAGETWRTMFAQHTTSGAPAPTMEGHVRQVGDIVLYRDLSGVTDTLYDMSLQVGDSVRYDIPWGGPFHLSVIAIDSLLIQGAYHRVIQFDTSDVFTLESWSTDRWIEGIGSMHGPLAPHHTQFVEDWFLMDSTRTTCYAQGSVLWMHPSYGSCIANIILGVDERSTDRISASPNPAREELLVNGLPHVPCGYRILDPLGRLQKAGTTSGNGTLRVDLRALQSGLHILQLDAMPMRSIRFLKE